MRDSLTQVVADKSATNGYQAPLRGKRLNKRREPHKARPLLAKPRILHEPDSPLVLSEGNPRHRRIHVEHGCQSGQLLGHVLVRQLDAVVAISGTKNNHIVPRTARGRADVHSILQISRLACIPGTTGRHASRSYRSSGSRKSIAMRHTPRRIDLNSLPGSSFFWVHALRSASSDEE